MTGANYTKLRFRFYWNVAKRSSAPVPAGVTEATWPAKPKIFTTQPLRGKLGTCGMAAVAGPLHHHLCWL